MERMSTLTVREIVRRKRQEYLRAGKAEKRLILDEVEVLTGYHRKSLVRLFLEQPGRRNAPIRRPWASTYGPILPHLRVLWGASFYACGKRLAPFVGELLTALKRFGEIEVTPDEEALLCRLSAATIDRMLKADRARITLKGRTTTKPGTLLKSRIPVRTFAQWDEREPGFIELDLVGHCGGSGSGEFLYTLNMTDVFSGWTALGAMKGRGERGTLLAIKSARRHIPFALKGIDSDNDGAFINHHLLRYCRKEQITFTRCRPYRKNDQCHVEQKNWSVVRQFIGYRRFETDEQLALLDKIYPLVMQYHNFFSPMMRLQSKERDGSKVTRRYVTPSTPYRRLLMADGRVDQETRESLTRQYEATNPAALLRQIMVLSRQMEDLADATEEARRDPFR
jgi:hypothetical protein